MGEILRCSCRGNNGECHMCFGSGVIEEETPAITASSPRVRPADKPRKKAPGKQLAPRREENSLEAAISRVLGLNRPHDGKLLVSLLELLARRVRADLIPAVELQALRSTLAKAAMCDRRSAANFLIELMKEVRQGGKNAKLALSDINSHIRIGTSARLTEPMLKLLVDARLAQAPKAEKQRVAENTAETRRSALPPPPKEPPPQREKVIEHLIVTADDGIDPQRVLDCKRFIERHRLKFIYLGGSKKAIRQMQDALPGIEIMPVTNPANIEMIRSGPKVASFNLSAEVHLRLTLISHSPR